jgi:hypothetical protein
MTVNKQGTGPAGKVSVWLWVILQYCVSYVICKGWVKHRNI